MRVRRIHIRATEEEPGVGVPGNSGGIGSGRPLVILVSGVQHQLDAVELEQSPIEAIPRLGRAHDLEAQHVAVKRDGGGHVEDFEKRREASNINGHVILSSGSILHYITVRSWVAGRARCSFQPQLLARAEKTDGLPKASLLRVLLGGPDGSPFRNRIHPFR